MISIQASWIKLKQHLNREDYDQISALQEKCTNTEEIALKLELDYKLGDAAESVEKTGMQEINEFMYFDGKQLIGYIGICSFGGYGSPFEITGMVHPDYRRQGIFSMLYSLVATECKRRNPSSILLLCDKKSDFGQRYLRKIGAAYKNSEFEMYLRQDQPAPRLEQLCGVTLRRADNTDAHEIARQNAIYFDEDLKDGILLPEDEEKRGMLIYLAEKDKVIVGKVHLQMNTAVGGIYGLGILPEYRGKGYGRAVLLRAIAKLKEANINTIMLQVAAENATALRLYQSCGFVETSTMDYFEAI